MSTHAMAEDSIAKNEPDSLCEAIYKPSVVSLYDFAQLSTLYPISPYEGLTIGEIRVEPLSVFDESNPKENNIIYRILNTLHIKTRSGVIRSQLLFAPGDRIRTSLIRESERILRKNNYLIEARIIPYRRCGDRIDLMVVTRDIWTLEPGVDFNHSGGNSSGGIGFSDLNLLGTGNHVAVS